MKNKTKQIAETVGLGVCGKWMSVNKLDQFTAEIIQECINAIEEVKKHPPTTYELDMMDKRLLDKCIDAIKDKFE